MQGLAPRSSSENADEQPGPRGGKGPGTPCGLWWDGEGGQELGRLRRNCEVFEKPGQRRDAAYPIGKTSGDLQDLGIRPQGTHIECYDRAQVGRLGLFPGVGGKRPDDVRADDGWELDVHRNPGNTPGNL